MVNSGGVRGRYLTAMARHGVRRLIPIGGGRRGTGKRRREEGEGGKGKSGRLVLLLLLLLLLLRLAL